jgi:hypothetical protein
MTRIVEIEKARDASAVVLTKRKGERPAVYF